MGSVMFSCVMFFNLEVHTKLSSLYDLLHFFHFKARETVIVYQSLNRMLFMLNFLKVQSVVKKVFRIKEVIINLIQIHMICVYCSERHFLRRNTCCRCIQHSLVKYNLTTLLLINPLLYLIDSSCKHDLIVK